MQKELNLEFRKANLNDNLEAIAELLYRTDPYIYPYWFGDLACCKSELPPLMRQEGFFFNIDNLYVAVDVSNNLIAGVVCIVDQSVNLSYDYSELEKVNDRYKFTINNYVKGLIKEVEESDFAYISNVCVHPDYRGLHIGSLMMKQIIKIYKEKYFYEISLDVLADNPGAIKLYKNMGFEQTSDIFQGFNNPLEDKPKVFSMKINLSERDI